MNTATVTLKIMGPMKRSTFQQQSPDRTEEAINDLLHWSWSTRLQMWRLTQSLRAEFRAWNWHHGVRRRRRFSATSCDEHLFLVAATNLDRALRAVPKTIRSTASLPESPRRALSLLRNIYEHWDELRKFYRSDSEASQGAARKLKSEFPKADPWSFTFDPTTGDIVLADVVALTPFVSDLRRLEHRLLQLERRRRREPLQRQRNGA